MIARLRRRHRRMVFALAIGAPLVMAVALLNRVPAVTDDSAPRAAQALAHNAVLVQRTSVVINDTTVQLGVHQTPGARSTALVIHPVGNAVMPADVLVYWQTSTPHRRPESDSVLLGSWSPSRKQVFDVPGIAANGGVIFYSLATDTLVATRWPLLDAAR